MQLTRLKEDFFTKSTKRLFFSEILGKKVKLKVSSKGIKTVEKKGGIDNYVITSKNSLLSPEVIKIKKIIQSKQADNK